MSRNYHPPGARLLHLAADRTVDALGQASDLLGRDQVTVGVTGLSRSGKTIFTTTALNNLSHAKRFALFAPIAQQRFEAAHFASPPAATTPRFPFEKTLDALYASPAHWPQGTTRISQIQLKIKCQPVGALERLMTRVGAGGNPLRVDLVDYPGEWLTDLPMLNQSFAQWSNMTIAAARTEPRAQHAAAWLDAVTDTDLRARFDERTGEHLHGLYAEFLRRCKNQATQLSRLQPGRFLVPGDLEGSSALTFCPLPVPELPAALMERDLYREFEKRFEAYKAQVIAPFYDEHLARIDRQIVLVDLLSVLNGGLPAVEELRETLQGILAFFRPGQNNPLQTLLLGRRVERLVFAVSKADHLPTSQHQALGTLLETLLFDQASRAQIDGANVKIMTLSALRAALPTTATREGREFDCVVGRPVGGMAKRVYFPGTLPATWQALKSKLSQSQSLPLALLDFEPPDDLPPANQGLPQLRVDEAVSFLIGDLL